MSDEQACSVAEIKLEHLGLGPMTMLAHAGFRHQLVPLSPDAASVMRREALQPACETTGDVKLAA